MIFLFSFQNDDKQADSCRDHPVRISNTWWTYILEILLMMEANNFTFIYLLISYLIT